MTIEKTPNGKYRVRWQTNGRRYVATFDEKPTQKEIKAAIEKKEGCTEADAVKGTFCDCAKRYIAIKENVLSPSTVREYTRIVNRLPEWFTETKMADLKQETIQRVINELSVGRSPKTVACYNGFISSVVAMFKPNMIIHTTLPQRRLTEPYVPTVDDIKQILDEAKGTKYEVPLRLACYGLRRSEICALELSDLGDDDMLSINKALVYDKNREWVKKTTKTTMSTRTIAIDHELAELIREQGYVFKGYPQMMTRFLYSTEKKLGMEQFSVHKFRHFFASRLLELDGVTNKDIMLLGGWKTDDTLKRVYQHSMKARTDEGKKQIASSLANGLFD